MALAGYVGLEEIEYRIERWKSPPAQPVSKPFVPPPAPVAPVAPAEPEPPAIAPAPLPPVKLPVFELPKPSKQK
jgi:hypothetical protein